MKVVINIEFFNEEQGTWRHHQFLKLSEARHISKWIKLGYIVRATKFEMSPPQYKSTFGI